MAKKKIIQLCQQMMSTYICRWRVVHNIGHPPPRRPPPKYHNNTLTQYHNIGHPSYHAAHHQNITISQQHTIRISQYHTMQDNISITISLPLIIKTSAPPLSFRQLTADSLSSCFQNETAAFA